MSAPPLKTMELNLEEYNKDLQLAERILFKIAKGDAGYMLMLISELYVYQREKGNFVEKTVRQQQREAMQAQEASKGVIL